MMMQYNLGSTARSTADLPPPVNGAAAAADRIQQDPIDSNVAAAAVSSDGQPSPAGLTAAPSSQAPPANGLAAGGGGHMHTGSHSPHDVEPADALMDIGGFNSLMSSSASLSPSLHEEEEGMGLLAAAPLSPSLFCMASDHAALESSLHAAGTTPASTSIAAGGPGQEDMAVHPPAQCPPVGSSPVRALDLAAPDVAGTSFSPFQRQRLAADAAQAALRQLLAPEAGRNPAPDTAAPLLRSASAPNPAAAAAGFPRPPLAGGVGSGSAFGLMDFDPSMFDLPRPGRFSSGGGSALFCPQDQHRVSWDGGLFGALPAVQNHLLGVSVGDMRRNGQHRQQQQQRQQLLAVADDAEAIMNQRTSEMMRAHQQQQFQQQQLQQPAHHLQLMGMYAGGSLPGGFMQQQQMGGGGGAAALDLSHYSHLGLPGGGGPAAYCRSLSQAGFQQASDEGGGGGGGGGGQLLPSSREFVPVMSPGVIKSGQLAADNGGGDGMEDDGAGGEDRRSTGSGVITRRDLEEVRGGDGN